MLNGRCLPFHPPSHHYNITSALLCNTGRQVPALHPLIHHCATAPLPLCQTCPPHEPTPADARVTPLKCAFVFLPSFLANCNHILAHFDPCSREPNLYCVHPHKTDLLGCYVSATGGSAHTFVGPALVGAGHRCETSRQQTCTRNSPGCSIY